MVPLNACAGDACSSPCICNDGDSGHDVKCVDGTLAAIPCHIPPQANGVYLSNNAITSISRGDLPPALRQLQYIFIDHNRLSSLDGDSFRGLTALGELFAPDNEITSVADDTFATNTHLGYIELNNNSLTAVPPLGGLTNLTMLSLTNNSIAGAITADDFPAADLQLLSSIELSGNQITTVSEAAFSKLPALQVYTGRLCLGRNPLNCCGLGWLRKLQALDSLCDAVAVCASPPKYAGKALAKTHGPLDCL